MNIYHPESWQLLKITTEDEVFYKVFGGWGDSWRANSGVTSYTVDNDTLSFFGSSGSQYMVDKHSEGIRGAYCLTILCSALEDAKEKDYDVQMISFEDFVLEFKEQESYVKDVYTKVLLSDLVALTNVKAIQTASETELEVLLYKLGIDIKYGFEQLTGLFRNPNNKLKVEQQIYWVGKERSDKEWRLSGAASEELTEAFRGKIARSINKL